MDVRAGRKGIGSSVAILNRMDKGDMRELVPLNKDCEKLISHANRKDFLAEEISSA